MRRIWLRLWGGSNLDPCAAGLDVATSLASSEVEIVALISTFEPASSDAIGLLDPVERLRFAAAAPSI